MNRVKGILLIALFLWSACKNQSGTLSFNTNTGKPSSITIDVSPDSAAKIAREFPDTIILKMDSTGKIGWTDRAIKITNLQQQVQDSLLNIYVRSGKLPSMLDIEHYGTVTMGIRGIADDMIRQAQQVVINAISVRTLNKPYGSLDPATQKKFREQYPALFQTYY